MAKCLHLHVVIATLSLLALSARSSTQSNGMKSLHFTIYLHDVLNKTSFVTAKGVVAGPEITSATSPFGTLYAYRDPLTLKDDPSSEAVGICEGLSVTTNFDGLSNIVVQKVILKVMNHTGSVVIVGDWESFKSPDVPIVGGTGDFFLVQGYMKPTLLIVGPPIYTWKMDFHLYWPPYAIQVSRHD